MPSLKPETAWRRILVDKTSPIKCRVAALKHLARPSLGLMRSLLSDPNTPGRLRFALAERYEIEVARKELARADR